MQSDVAASRFERLEKRFNTVGALWHDAHAEWQVVADPGRRLFQDCRLEGRGATLDEAVENLESKIGDAGV